MKKIILVSTLLSIQIIATKTLAQEIKKDSIVPSSKDGVALAQSVCGAGDVTQDKGKVGCKTCPSFTSEGSYGDRITNSGGTLKSVIYGSFSKAGSREALVDFDGCEPHNSNYGGTVLLQRTNQGWSFVRYEKGLHSNICLKLPTHANRHSLICEGYYANHGRALHWLETVEFSANKTITTRVLELASNAGSCRPPYYTVEIKDFALRDINKDSRPDLVVKVSEAKATTEGNHQNCEEPTFGKPKFYQLKFLSNGQSFRPTPTTASLMKRLEVK